MRRSWITSLTLTVLMCSVFSASAMARKTNPRWDPEGLKAFEHTVPSSGTENVLGLSSHTDTTYFGGTVWDGTDGRWEAIEHGCWTFDSGVGSAIVGDLGGVYPGADPNKDNTLHAVMEGWVGFDRTYNTLPFFRRLENTTTAPIIGGSWSFWCGVLQSEAAGECFRSGQGYGNNWNICIGRTFAYAGGGVTWDFDYRVETELYNDIVTVEIDTTNSGDIVQVATYSGIVIVGNESLALSPGVELPSAPGNVQFRYCFYSDRNDSDQDGYNPTASGAFAVDNIDITGGITHSADFETSADGWALLTEPGHGGDWSTLVHLNDLPPPLTPRNCAMSDTVMVFEDLVNTGHGLHQDNLAGSPWIDLDAAGLSGSAGYFIEFGGYFWLSLRNYIFVQLEVQYFPKLGGIQAASDWHHNGFVYYFGPQPQCNRVGSSYRQDFTGVIPPSATDVRIAIGVLNYCKFFGNCNGISNSTPWFDDVKLGVFDGGPTGAGVTASVLSTRSVNVPQDAFPENGTLNISAPGRFDSNFVNDESALGFATPEIGTSLGDTLVVYGGGDGPGDEGSEVYVEFQVIPGPGVNPAGLAAFYAGKGAGLQGAGWYSARMDSAEVNGGGAHGMAWMTTYHEDDPNFSGTDTDLDGGDLDPYGNTTRLANDIFPDDLFTPGTRVHVRFRTNFDTTTPGAGPVYWTPPLVRSPLEYEVLPSSMDGADTTWNCVLYVNHFDDWGGGPELIQPALSTLLGAGSNYDGYAWDRWDVRAPDSHVASFGRPLSTEYGATVVQALGYSCILWDSGFLPSVNLVKEDADILIPWLTLADFDMLQPHQLYLSGNNLAASMTYESPSEPSALTLLNDLMGVTLDCSTFWETSCPGASPLDLVPCVELEPVGGAPVAGIRSVTHVGQGNGLPTLRSFDVLSVNTPDFGSSAADERYAGSSKNGDYASIAVDAGGGTLSFKGVVDGISVIYRRDDDTTSCSFTSVDTTAITERLDEVLAYLSHGGGGTTCEDISAGIGIGNTGPTYTTGLARFAPNPLRAGATGSISFTLERKSHARVDVFDLSGRLVRTLFNGMGQRGPNTVTWNGTDTTGRQVASGVYFYRLSAGFEEFSKKLVVIRSGS